MAETDVKARDAFLGCDMGDRPGHFDCRSAGWLMNDLNILAADATRPSRAQGFEHCLLAGKTRREPSDAVWAITGVIPLMLSKAPANKAVAGSLYKLFELIQLHDVDTVPDEPCHDIHQAG